MFTIEKQELRKIETSIFNRAKTKSANAEPDKYLNVYIKNLLSFFFDKLFTYRSGNDVNTKMNLEELHDFFCQKLEGKATIEKEFVYYSQKMDGFKVIVNEDFIMSVSCSKSYYYGKCADKGFYFYDDELDKIFGAIDLAIQRLPEWRARAEKVKQKVLKERMTAKLSKTALQSVIETKLNALGLEYHFEIGSKSSTLSVKLSENQTGTFYLKNDNLVEEVDEVVEMAKRMSAFFDKGNKMQVRFKSIYDGFHNYEYEHRLDKWK